MTARHDQEAAVDSELTSTRWRTSSHSGNTGGNCVEIAEATGTTTGPACLVRDSTDPAGPVLTIGRQDWERFTTTLKTPAR